MSAITNERTRAAINDWMAAKDGRKSRWHELFGTPEKTARTLYYDKVPICAGCALMDECKKTPDEEYDMCFLLDYDWLLEWLRGDA